MLDYLRGPYNKELSKRKQATLPWLKFRLCHLPIKWIWGKLTNHGEGTFIIYQMAAMILFTSEDHFMK